MTQTLSGLASYGGSALPPVAMVPHVNIHAFCETEKTADTLRLATADRRMARAHTIIQLGGIPAAIQLFQTEATPNLLIVESQAQRSELFSQLAALAEVCQAETKVIVIGQINDVLLYRDLVRQGVSEYLVAPMTQLAFIETVASIYRNPKAPPLGRVLAFMGARGGVGSSVICHSCAYDIASRLKTDSVIVDLDLVFGTSGLNFNQDVPGGIFDALVQPDRVDSVLLERMLTKLGERLNLLAAPGGMDREVEITPHAVETVVGALRALVPFVALDIPREWNPWVKSALRQADQVVITACPELSSLRNARNIVEALTSARPNDPPPLIVLNQAGMGKRPEIPLPDFRKAVGAEVAAVIPHDPQGFGAALNSGQTVFEAVPKSKTVEELRALATRLSGVPLAVAKPAPRGRSLLGKLSFARKS